MITLATEYFLQAKSKAAFGKLIPTPQSTWMLTSKPREALMKIKH